MNNQPTLFVESIIKKEIGNENQNIYDSRKHQKGRVHHRIDDINSFKSINKRIWVSIHVNSNSFFGEVLTIDKSNISLNIGGNILNFMIKDIVELKISSIQ